MAETQKTRTDSNNEGGEEELQSDIWTELRNLRDMVVEQKVELSYLTARVAAAESLVETLKTENRGTLQYKTHFLTFKSKGVDINIFITAIETRMSAAESLAEELQMKNDAQASELAVTQQKLSTLQQRLTDNELLVQELEKQQEVGKVAFSTSLLASGEGNTSSDEFVSLLFSNVITNIGNHYNPNTGHFTAPARGVYYFTFTGFTAHTESAMRLRLVKNGNLIVFAGDCATSTDSEDNASNAAVLHLELGDVVAVQRAGTVWDDQYHRTTFGGFLLFPFSCKRSWRTVTVLLRVLDTSALNPMGDTAAVAECKQHRHANKHTHTYRNPCTGTGELAQLDENTDDFDPMLCL
ncbi:Complement C1q-like protein 2 C1q and tumor necrosis factor-related protein 10 [Channa argus]|uniref:Complement C1q-like protein 2 C1q and tumor necrosis factor-related protein 10 n=1 Tax=Channa argus TaxID=215402 RepID=A0A6G1Q3J5_CHAAH|nr:Complement C1q-like protein 2 C1q and tumor necrosis factor-related protein 10 [Channa argus]